MEVVLSIAYWIIVGIIYHLSIDLEVVFTSYLNIPQKVPFKGGNQGDTVIKSNIWPSNV